MGPLKPLTHHVIRDHVLLGGLVSLSMLPAYGWRGTLLFWTATVLIDLDHYAKFFLKTKFRAWHPDAMFRYFHEVFLRRQRPEFLIVEYFHTIEVFAVLGILAFLFGGLWMPLFWGIVFHEIVDIIQLFRHKLLTRRCYSILEYAWRVRRLKKLGWDPDAIYQEAFQAAGFDASETAGRSTR